MSELPVVGIDIGGSKIAAGLIDRDGRVLRRSQAVTPVAGRAGILAVAQQLVTEIISGRPIAGIGIGAGGVIVDGTVIAATSLLPGWAGTELAGHFAGVFNVPATAINDVHAHGVGEAWCGAGAGRDTVLVVAVGTGLGGVVVHGGTPLIGAHGIAGHLGHIASPAAEGLLCSCGATGHLEAIASGYGIVQLYRSMGGDPSVADSSGVIARADSDDYADRTVRRSAVALGAGLGALITIIDPDVVIMSGGVTAAGPSWWDEMRSAAGLTALPLVSTTPIVPALLGADAGIVGAARFLITSLQG